MTLLELYNIHRNSAAFYLEKSELATSNEVRDAFKSRSLENQIMSGHIAHCMAMFGDSKIANLDFKKLHKIAKDLPCINENPWLRGLSRIHDVFLSTCERR